MSIERIDGRLVHYPNGPKFEFDKEVAKIFPDMAKRSLPMYEDMQRVHLRMVRELVMHKGMDAVRICDVGASVGTFIEKLYSGLRAYFQLLEIEFDVFETSQPMLEQITKRMAEPVRREEGKVQLRLYNEAFQKVEVEAGAYDVVVAHYVHQFVPASEKSAFLRALVNSLKSGGVLLFAHKAGTRYTGPAFDDYDIIQQAVNDEYINFRLNNGYSMEEIIAKSNALEGVMETSNHDKVVSYLTDLGMTPAVYTTCSGPFISYAMIKE